MESLGCRVCLQTGTETIDMLTAFYNPRVSLLEVFAQCTEVAMEVGENSLLCINCEQRLIAAYEFRCQAQTASILMKRASTSVIKEETPEYMDDDNFFDDDNYHQSLIDVKHEEIKSESYKPKIMRTESTNKIVRKPRAPGPPSFPGMLNKNHCKFCLQYIKFKLGEHEREHIAQNGGLQCHHCEKKYQNRKILLEHLKCVHFTNKHDPNRPRYACDICGKTYSEKSSVRGHKRDAHSDNPRPKKKEICPLCGKKATHLQKHIDMVHKNIICCYCDMCGKGFKSKGSLASHLKFYHMGIKPIQCPICEKFYRTTKEVETHINGVHTTEKRYECNTCGKKFKTEPSYRFHIKMHQTSLDHKCDICGAGFKTKHYMLGHMKVHSEVKNYICSVCSMSFKRSGQLTKHMRKHTGQMFYCNQCVGIGFVDTFSLKEHNERVHIGVRYRCDTCGKDYGSRKHLRQHQNAQFHDRTLWTKLVPTLPILAAATTDQVIVVPATSP